MPKKHKFQGRCEASEKGVDAILEKQRDALEKHGWFAHYVTGGDAETPNGYNYHTHGFAENLGHPDFQICLRIDPNIAHTWFHYFATEIKAGKKFDPGSGPAILKAEFCQFDIKLMRAKEGGRPLIRIIIPDGKGSLDPLTMDPAYAEQYSAAEAGLN